MRVAQFVIGSLLEEKPTLKSHFLSKTLLMYSSSLLSLPYLCFLVSSTWLAG